MYKLHVYNTSTIQYDTYKLHVYNTYTIQYDTYMYMYKLYHMYSNLWNVYLNFEAIITTCTFYTVCLVRTMRCVIHVHVFQMYMYIVIFLRVHVHVNVVHHIQNPSIFWCQILLLWTGLGE